MLMINTDVQAFVTQAAVAQGSSDIQTIINAQRQLSYIKSVHPAIEALYVYSKKSDYLLEADNAFFDIDAMYPAFFAFDGLTARQWRKRYLEPVYTNTWQPETAILSKGVRKNLLIFEQTFPLQNTAANTGKLIILVKTAYFDGLFPNLFTLEHTELRLTDSRYRALLTRISGKPDTRSDIPHDIRSLLHAESNAAPIGVSDISTSIRQSIDSSNRLICTEPIRDTGITLAAVIPQVKIFYLIKIRPFAIFTLLSGVLLLALIFGSIARFRIKHRKINNDIAAGHDSAADINPFHFDTEHRGVAVSGQTKHKPDITSEFSAVQIPLQQDTENPISEESETVPPDKDFILIARIRDYLALNYANALLNLPQMAKDFDMTENFLYYFFRSRIKKSFAQYLEDLRLEKARQLLEGGRITSMNVIAERCGYSNTQTFRRAFKKRYGITPSEFRRQNPASRSEL